MPIEGNPKVLEFAYPVHGNAKTIKDAIGVWDGIALHAQEINKTKHSDFFALVQKFSLDSAVLGVSKIYDKTNAHNKKHTAHDLINYLDNNIKKAVLWGYNSDTITTLGVSTDLIEVVSQSDNRSQCLAALKEVVEHLKNTMPTAKNDKALEKIIACRDRRTVHQERLPEAKKEWLSTLPPTEDFIRLAVWAESLCDLVASCFCNVAMMPHTTPCARMSVLGVLVKALDKDFGNLKSPEQWEEYNAFFRAPI